MLFGNLLMDAKPSLLFTLFPPFQACYTTLMAVCNAFADGRRYPCQTTEDLIVFCSNKGKQVEEPFL